MIVAIIPDRYQDTLDRQLMDVRENSGNGRKRAMADVRRPTRGIQLKEDTYATLKLLRGNGEEIPLVNAGSRLNNPGKGPDGKMMSNTYSNFLIQSVTEERVEKSQVVETFGEAFIFFYGQRPRVLTIQGVLLNTFDFNWESEWWYNYDNYLRGTKCVEQEARVYLLFDDTMVSGYIMSTTSTKNSAERNFVPFVFQLFVTDYSSISRVGNPNPDQRGIQPVSLSDKANRPWVSAPKQFTRLGGKPFTGNTEGSLGGGMSLLGSLMSQGLNAVNSAFSLVSSAANMAMIPITYLDGFIGNPVRIPVGFEGAVVFDETKVALDLSTQLLDPVRYSSEFG